MLLRKAIANRSRQERTRHCAGGYVEEEKEEEEEHDYTDGVERVLGL